MKVKKSEIAGVVLAFATVAKLSGGDDLIHFSADRISVRSHVMDIDVLMPGLNIDAVVSAKTLDNILRDMGAGDLDIRDMKSQIKISDGVRKGTLKKKDISDDRVISMDYDDMTNLSERFWEILEMCIFDGTGNKGIQFLGDVAVNKTNPEMLIMDISTDPFYLNADQVGILTHMGMGTDARIQITDNVVRFTDLTTYVECRRGRVPSGVTVEGIEKFQTQMLKKAIPIFSQILPDTMASVLKHVSSFGEDDQESGKSVIISFDHTTSTVCLSGENMTGSFEETVDMEYTGDVDISLSASVSVLRSLIGKSFTLLERPDLKGYYLMVSEDTEKGLQYIGTGKKG